MDKMVNVESHIHTRVLLLDKQFSTNSKFRIIERFNILEFTKPYL